MAMLLWVSADYFGVQNVALFYLLPYLWTNHWIRKYPFI